jgi:hypothetical protein
MPLFLAVALEACWRPAQSAKAHHAFAAQRAAVSLGCVASGRARAVRALLRSAERACAPAAQGAVDLAAAWTPPFDLSNPLAACLCNIVVAVHFMT